MNDRIEALRLRWVHALLTFLTEGYENPERVETQVGVDRFHSIKKSLG